MLNTVITCQASFVLTEQKHVMCSLSCVVQSVVILLLCIMFLMSFVSIRAQQIKDPLRFG